jgi:LmbE family N-acetylglucosaminyl deacetylase
MMNTPQRILILGPHTDDGEWGAGASIARWLEQGHQVWYAAFSAAEESVREEFAPDVLRTEIIAATAELGISPANLRVLQHKVRYFPRDRQDILEEMIRLRREINPTLVVQPSSYDTHQDHKIISEEGFRAFKRCSILGYEIPWNNRKIDLTYFQEVSAANVEKKIRAIAAYKSQVFRNPRYQDFIRSLAVQRGFQVGCEYAEAYEVIRWVAH